MALLGRSIPGTISSTEETPPVTVVTTTSTSKADKMASSGFANFAKSILLPMFISLGLYLLIFHALLPLYRRHRARYSQYLPLQTATSTISSHLPEFLQGLSLRDRLSHMFFRVFLPSTWAIRNRFMRRRDSVISADGELFDEESGEAMVGFDVQERNRRRDGMERQVSNMDAATRTVARGTNGPIVRHPPPEEVDSNRRLSRELEEGFRDDSDDEGDDSQLMTATPTNAARR
ncbi:uncharacterized protein A1O9_02996 [Exophiala aquamarina CBS 119918]|uniref:Uncharacterized protein n=1 Tax=Exophiala aquamarina CBS 119918 TaxID=1182545 RepID=A0A072Q0L9_9EURO|nr:uncharacterized protein A1O9_02996 [Exophiala aquamarina CBS 119918]KEF61430.1 hypothetical protein A1O9_02996 [Exophiala aquamarina CBS 119918]